MYKKSLEQPLADHVVLLFFLSKIAKEKRVDLKGHDFTKAVEKFLEKFLGIVSKRCSCWSFELSCMKGLLAMY